MKKIIVNLLMSAGLMASVVAVGSDIKDGNALVKPMKDNRYSIDGAAFGKAELFGVISDMKDVNHLTGIVLTKGGTATLEQRRAISSIANTLKLQAFIEEGGKLTPVSE